MIVISPHVELLLVSADAITWFTKVRTRAVAPTTRACFNLPEAGTYAVVIYHDADGDSDFDRSAIGRPTEGFGFSNDAPARLGLPSFRSVRFAVTPGDNTIRIQTRYP